MITDGEKDCIDSIMNDYQDGNVDDMIAFVNNTYDRLPENLVTQEIKDRRNRLIAYLETKKG